MEQAEKTLPDSVEICCLTIFVLLVGAGTAYGIYFFAHMVSTAMAQYVYPF